MPGPLNLRTKNPSMAGEAIGPMGEAAIILLNGHCIKLLFKFVFLPIGHCHPQTSLEKLLCIMDIANTETHSYSKLREQVHWRTQQQMGHLYYTFPRRLRVHHGALSRKWDTSMTPFFPRLGVHHGRGIMQKDCKRKRLERCVLWTQ